VNARDSTLNEPEGRMGTGGTGTVHMMRDSGRPNDPLIHSKVMSSSRILRRRLYARIGVNSSCSIQFSSVQFSSVHQFRVVFRQCAKKKKIKKEATGTHRWFANVWS
jgi:hypothetical protein